MTGAVIAEVLGLPLRVDCELEEFAAFLRHGFGAFLSAPAAAPALQVAFGREAGCRARARRDAMDTLGMGLFCDREALYWENAFGFALLLEPGAAPEICVSAYHFDLDREAEPDLRGRNLQRALRWAVHFPLFALLARRRELGLLHGSAVACEKGALVLCGLNKVGKSTLGAYLAHCPGYRFMTDNFLLYDDRRVFGFPEALRLAPESLARLGLRPTWSNTVYGKHHLSLEAERTCLQSEPAAFVLVTNGAELSLEPLDPGCAADLLHGLHQYLAEFPAQSYLAALPLLDAGWPADTGVRDRLLRESRWFKLSLPRTWALADARELLEQCI